MKGPIVRAIALIGEPIPYRSRHPQQIDRAARVSRCPVTGIIIIVSSRGSMICALLVDVRGGFRRRLLSQSCAINLRSVSNRTPGYLTFACLCVFLPFFFVFFVEAIMQKKAMDVGDRAEGQRPMRVSGDMDISTSFKQRHVVVSVPRGSHRFTVIAIFDDRPGRVIYATNRT